MTAKVLAKLSVFTTALGLVALPSPAQDNDTARVWPEPRQNYPITLVNPDRPVKIDGNLAEWQDAAELFPFPQPKGSDSQIGYEGTSDLFATFRLLWDANHIYVAAEISDSSLEIVDASPGMLWANDGIEVFLDMDLSDRGRKSFSDDDFQFLLCPVSLVLKDQKDGWTSPQSTGDDAILMASRKTATGYFIEAAIKIPEKWRPRLKTGSALGLDVSVNDCDKGYWRRNLRWFPWGKASEDARARHTAELVADSGMNSDKRFESSWWNAAPDRDLFVVGVTGKVIVAASDHLKNPVADIIYHDETGRELVLVKEYKISGVSEIPVAIPPVDGKLDYNAFMAIYGRSEDGDGILATWPVTVADPIQFAGKSIELASCITGISKGAATLRSNAASAVEKADPAAFRKAVEDLEMLREWGTRDIFTNPPAAGLESLPVPGEKADLMIYGIPGDYATFPGITRTEKELIIDFPVQSVALAGRSEEHPHHQLFSDTCWAVSRNGGMTWHITRDKPEYGNVLHATRSLDAFAKSPSDAWKAMNTAIHDDAATAALGKGASFHVFDFTRAANGDIIAAGYGKAPALTAKRTILLVASTDGGKTWKYRSAIPNNGTSNLEEPALYTAADGRIVCIIRTGWESASLQERLDDGGLANFHWAYNPFAGPAGYGGYMLQSESRDNGMTWSDPVSTGLWGHPANIMRLDSGKVLMVYGHRRSPWTVRAILSRDDGKTWDKSSIRIIREFRPGTPDMGYPVITQLPGGPIVCSYYGYRTGAVARYPSPQSIFISIFDEAWLAKGESPADIR